jgi:hypothetical protein
LRHVDAACRAPIETALEQVALCDGLVLATAGFTIAPDTFTVH